MKLNKRRTDMEPTVEHTSDDTTRTRPKRCLVNIMKSERVKSLKKKKKKKKKEKKKKKIEKEV